MSIWKNNAEIPAPDQITVFYSSHHLPVRRENGKYCLPNLWPNYDQKLDVAIQIGDDRLYLSSISITPFDAPWRLSYGSEINKQIPKHPRQKIKAACELEVDKGEPGIGFLINPCVMPSTGHE